MPEASLSSGRELRPNVGTIAGLAIIAGLWCVLATAPAFALDPDRSLAQLQHTAWTVSDGAPSQVSALAQTADGWLWIGSALGLFRFDGVEFERYTPPAGTRLPSYNIYAMAATPDSGLWVSFRPSGLGFIKGRSFVAYTRPEELPASEVYELACDHDGRVWAGVRDGLYFHDADGWHPVGPERNIPKNRVSSLYTDRRGTLWAANDLGLFSLARGADSFVRVRSGLGYITSVASTRNGRTWVARFDPHSLVPVDEAPGARPLSVSENAAFRILFDRDDCMWVAKGLDGLWRVRDHEAIGRSRSRSSSARIEKCTRLGGLSGEAVRVELEDHEGNIWVGTSGGIDRFRHSRLVATSMPGLGMALVPGDSGSIWAVSAVSHHMVRIKGGDSITYPGFDAVDCFYRESPSRIWWAGLLGIVLQEGSRTVRYPMPSAFQDRWIWELFPGDAPGSLWASIDNIGLVAFEHGKFQQRAPPSLPDRGPSASFPTGDGRVWLGFSGDRVAILDHGKVTAYSHQDGIDVGRVRVIRGRGGHMWVGGELGLDLFEAGRFHAVATEDGMPFGTVSGIVETPAGDLWLNEMRGIVHISREEVARLLVDPGHRILYRRYDYLDGMPGGGQMNWTCSTATQGSDGRLWFATDNGIVSIDPATVGSEPAPPVVIRSIDANGTSYPPSAGLRLPRGTSNLTIRYAAATLAEPERMRFRYRLEGLDRGWRDADTRRIAIYTRLKPRDYRFRVMAQNPDGVWTASAASFGFSIAPEFYQTGWFKVLIALAIAGMVWALFLLRVGQVTARLQRLHEVRTDERMRIARELHDTLLQGFVSASMQLHATARSAPPDTPIKAGIDRVLALMRIVTEEARTAVVGLRGPHSDAVQDLEEVFAQAAREFERDASARLRLSVHGQRRPLRPLSHDEICRVGREAMANAFRHAQAEAVEVEIGYLSEELRVTVRDDGRGIDPGLTRTGRDGHWGLTGMRERAAGLRARLTVELRAGGGTEVVLRVPGRVAYADAKPDGRYRKLAERLGAGPSQPRARDGGA